LCFCFVFGFVFFFVVVCGFVFFVGGVWGGGGAPPNWLGYNYAHDVQLPGSTKAAVPFLMYPQAENAQGRLDSLDAENFRYRIASRENSA
jgi:hypothetical protein